MRLVAEPPCASTTPRDDNQVSNSAVYLPTCVSRPFPSSAIDHPSHPLLPRRSLASLASIFSPPSYFDLTPRAKAAEIERIFDELVRRNILARLGEESWRFIRGSLPVILFRFWGDAPTAFHKKYYSVSRYSVLLPRFLRYNIFLYKILYTNRSYLKYHVCMCRSRNSNLIPFRAKNPRITRDFILRAYIYI